MNLSFHYLSNSFQIAKVLNLMKSNFFLVICASGIMSKKTLTNSRSQRCTTSFLKAILFSITLQGKSSRPISQIRKWRGQMLKLVLKPSSVWLWTTHVSYCASPEIHLPLHPSKGLAQCLVCGRPISNIHRMDEWQVLTGAWFAHAGWCGWMKVCSLVTLLTWVCVYTTRGHWVSLSSLTSAVSHHWGWTMRFAHCHWTCLPRGQGSHSGEEGHLLPEQCAAPLAFHYPWPAGPGSQEVLWEVLCRLHRPHQWVEPMVAPHVGRDLTLGGAHLVTSRSPQGVPSACSPGLHTSVRWACFVSCARPCAVPH